VQSREGNEKPEKTRNPKFETNPNDQKSSKFQTSSSGISILISDLRG
jgi:hypothetical protein